MKMAPLIFCCVVSAAIAQQEKDVEPPLTTVGTEGVVKVVSAHELEAVKVNAKSTVIVGTSAGSAVGSTPRIRYGSDIGIEEISHFSESGRQDALG